MPSTIFVSTSPRISGSILSDLFQQLGIDIRSTDFTFAPSQGTASISQDVQKYTSAVVLFENAESLDVGLFGSLTSCLQPGAAVTVCGVQETSTSDLTHKLVLNGLVDVTADSAAHIGACKILVKGKTPSWTMGSKALLSKKQPAAAPTAPAQKWTVAADEDEELIDDDELLTDEDLKRPAPVNADDCEVGAGRKACKNCSCGRAEAEAAAVKLTPDMLENPTSACGNCFLGDAFRCASCPYRGLPAFEKGQKIELPTSFLTADV